MPQSSSFLLYIFFLVVAVLLSRAESGLTAMTEESSSAAIVPHWPPSTNKHVSVKDLHHEYNTIFRYGNRNAASHRWSTFLLDRSSQMTEERLEFFFSGFCAVSGSPVRPSNYNRYKLRLPKIGGGRVTGTMHYCCWPCVCDTQDYIRIDTKNVTVASNNPNSNETTTTKQLYFAVIGNPCDRPEQLEEPFVQPFYGGRTTTLSETAREVRCLEDGSLEGATLSDHGYVIISMFFDAQLDDDQKSENDIAFAAQPGRITTHFAHGKEVMVQDEREYGPRCEDRANHGYNSGMGEIFRKVCAISPIPTEALEAKILLGGGDEPPSCDANANLGTGELAKE